MRYVIFGLVFFGLGLGSGYLIRDAKQAPRSERAERVPAPAAASPPPAAPAAPAADAPPVENTPGEPAGKELPAPVEAVEKKKEEKKSALLGMLKGAAPLMLASAERDARRVAATLAQQMNLPPHRAKLLADALVADAKRQIELGLLPMLNGEKPDPDAMAELHKPDGYISVALERDLSGVLGAHELDRVREYYRAEEEREVKERIDSQVREFALPDLTEDQDRRLREVLRAEQDPKKTDSVAGMKESLEDLSGEELVLERMEQQQAERREKLAAFLSPEQLARYDEHAKQELQETKLAMGLFGNVLKEGDVKIKVGGDEK